MRAGAVSCPCNAWAISLLIEKEIDENSLIFAFSNDVRRILNKIVRV